MFGDKRKPDQTVSVVPILRFSRFGQRAFFADESVIACEDTFLVSCRHACQLQPQVDVKLGVTLLQCAHVEWFHQRPIWMAACNASRYEQIVTDVWTGKLA